MRAAAEVHEGAVGVDGDDLVVAQLRDPLQLEGIVGEAAVGLRPGHHLAHERVVGPDYLLHHAFDLQQVLRGEGPRHLEVVVEAVLDGRAEADPGAGKDLAHRGGEHMRGRMAQHLQRGGIAVGEDGDGGILLDGPGEIAHLAAHPDGQRLVSGSYG